MNKRILKTLSLSICICLLFTMTPVHVLGSSNVPATTSETDGTLPGDSEVPGTPGTDNPGNPDTSNPGNPDNPDTSDPDNPGDPGNPDNPNTGGSDDSETETPEDPVTPEPEPLKITGAMYKTNYTYVSWKSADSKATYNIYRSTKAKSGFKKIGTVSNKSGTVKFYDKAKKLTLGTTYYYQVKKVINKETVDTSNTVSVKIQILPPKNVKASITSANDVKLTWDKSSYATYYTIYRSTSKDGKYKKVGTSKTTSYTDKTPDAAKAYYYRIFARKNSGTANSKSSDTIAAYTKTAKPSVTVKYSSKAVNLSWKKVTRATIYYIYKENSSGKYVKIASTKSLKYKDTDVKENKSYSYKVRGVYTKDKKNIGGFYSSVARAYTGKIDPNKKMVALTFDDGPGIYTDDIVKCLNKYGGHATFFVVGNRVNTYKDELKFAYDSGNEIANHTYTHPTLTRLSTSKIKSEISKTDKAVKKITGQTPTLVRAPGGATNATVRKTVGKPFIYWSIDTLDWKHRNSKKTVNAVMKNVKDGDIILMHDIHKPTKTAALELIPKLKKAGYQLVTVSELAQYRGYKLKNGTTYYSLR